MRLYKKKYININILEQVEQTSMKQVSMKGARMELMNRDLWQLLEKVINIIIYMNMMLGCDSKICHIYLC